LEEKVDNLKSEIKDLEDQKNNVENLLENV